MASRWIQKVCEVCGETTGMNSKVHVCHACVSKAKGYALIEKILEDVAATYAVTIARTGNSGLYGFRHDRDIERAYEGLIEVLSTKFPDRYSPIVELVRKAGGESKIAGEPDCIDSHYGASLSCGTSAIRQDVADALVVLNDAIREHAHRRYEEGKAYGASLVRRLSEGEMSVEKFNEDSAPKPRRTKRY